MPAQSNTDALLQSCSCDTTSSSFVSDILPHRTGSKYPAIGSELRNTSSPRLTRSIPIPIQARDLGGPHGIAEAQYCSSRASQLNPDHDSKNANELPARILLPLICLGVVRTWLIYTGHLFTNSLEIMKTLFGPIRILIPLVVLNGVYPNEASVPQSFPKSGKVLWFRTPGVTWATDYLPVGNGYLAAMVPGETVHDETTLNIESLWSGGPFQSDTYTGGNADPSDAPTLHADMQNIRSEIFGSPNGTIPNAEFDIITTPIEYYGSYTSPGRLAVTLLGNNTSGPITQFTRWLDLDLGVARSQWNVGNNQLTRETFCSHPSQACLQHTQTSINKSLSILYAFAATPSNPVPTVDCFDDNTLLIRGTASDPGMTFEMLARVQTEPSNLASCTAADSNATILADGVSSSWITWVGGTNFDQNAGDASHNFSFQGSDPHDSLVTLLGEATSQSYTTLFQTHVDDVAVGLSTKSPFQLSLGQEPEFTNSTDELRAMYEVDTGNPYLEWLTFHFGRYMLFSSARGNLPANLQGKWARDSSNPWGADYHSNINLQMNYWSAESTNLNVTASLWDYLEKNWAPRGAVTAQLLYNISRGWVTHDEIFGYTGMKGVGGTAEWADYPESAVWLMIHLWDHFDYTNDADWWRVQGWPLLKGVASFHLDKLINDLHFNDGTLVVAPCNSPEQPPITLGCAHSQQIIWQMFNAVEKGFLASGDSDTEFLQEVQAKRAQMDKGIHIGSWGQLQGQTDNTKEEVLSAAEISLIHRGNGTGPDADAGWEKVWRAAAWAQLFNASTFYHELTYTLQRNFGPNLISLYDPGDPDPIFQIDANLGYPGAVINALLQAPDVPSYDSTLTITLLPALPSAWSTGSFTGLKVRGGVSVNLVWRNGRPSSGSVTVDEVAPSRKCFTPQVE
ncbi:hypothetical protein Clacol_007262 [Clathrus columnatus]|uniref:Glycoside hydrolase family 95 protein n=1 Tax=Clathrus columnatus TaxID=1419009 RepID=A0AAV5AIR5_9AGAM|nr:hypothetical protein Clacol_007262 [Clathrus columnatus]